MSLFNKIFAKEYITHNQKTVLNSKGEEEIVFEPVSYKWTHGATDFHLGDGLLIYATIQHMRAKTCVCLGSGGGFIPRIMVQARLDLYDQGIFEGNNNVNWGDIGSTFIVDAANGIGGTVDWAEENSFFRKHFCPRVILDRTDIAFHNFFVKEDIKIDYLHIDAGHSYEDVKRDFTLYSSILSPNAIVSIHDTDINYAKNYIVTKDVADQDHHQTFAEGPSQFVNELGPEWQRFDFFNEGILNTKPSSTGLTLIRRA